VGLHMLIQVVVIIEKPVNSKGNMRAT